ncbi:DUF3043 domain-containing protein [Mycolicibacterium pallens]|uniref:DUF3043 domain-containing protein n=1 Tax=Mycolicibacterium pallens TaxID=370524 RepID=A0ABX8VBC6_9MYCO|nr:DUF3043 domain-containing protein [Mycolicibacterium pallens]APE18867.1 hypothetical protein BOH72_03590 [Mycobacterium sp. WY10]QYL15090.1 DUF3043 domain-containing protein [Mycolicibacterium pallens]
MKLLGRKNDEGAAKAEPVEVDEPAVAAGTTAPKGKPTPKRSASAKRRGPVAPAPMTTAEARKRRKEMRKTLTKEERQAEKAQRRTAMNDRRERMMAGEEAYLLPRDQGPVRRYARDIVDSRHNVLGLFMPAALALIFVMLAVPQVQLFISPAMLLLMAIMAIDGILLGRKVNKAVDAKFPDNTEGAFKLGMYAAGRASQIRRMRAPRPQVERGAKVV